MEEITVKARTKDLAISKALQKLGTTREKVEVRVLAEGQPGLLGWLGIFPARVTVRFRSEDRTRASYLVQGILERMGIPAEVEANETSEGLDVEIRAESDGGLLIGHHGRTLRALRFLLSKMLSDESHQPESIQVDVNGYIRGRDQNLRARAREMADRAVSQNRRVQIGPLPASERRVVHEALREDNRVQTMSRGHGPRRVVLIAPKGLELGRSDRKSRGPRREGGGDRRGRRGNRDSRRRSGRDV